MEIKKFDNLGDLENEWKGLQKNSELYLTFESVQSYVRNIVGKNILIYALYDERKIKSILPIRYENNACYLICHNFGFNLEPLGEETEDFIKDVINNLSKEKSLIIFEPVTREFSESLKVVSDKLGLKIKIVKSREKLYRLTLPNTWKAFLDSLDSKFRKNLRYYENKIKGKYKFENLEKQKDLEIFFRLHSLSMKDRGDLSILEFKKFQDYYTGMVSSFGKNAGLFNLLMEEKIVASLVYIDFRGIRYFLNIGVDPKYKEYSVGRILIAHTVEDAINSGLKYFDFGKGDSQYKLDWGCNIIENDRVVMWSNSFAYVIYNFKNFVYNNIKKIAIRLLKINLLKSILLKR